MERVHFLIRQFLRILPSCFSSPGIPRKSRKNPQASEKMPKHPSRPTMDSTQSWGISKNPQESQNISGKGPGIAENPEKHPEASEKMPKHPPKPKNDFRR